MRVAQVLAGAQQKEEADDETGGGRGGVSGGFPLGHSPNLGHYR